jgi:hypothetical protein
MALSFAAVAHPAIPLRLVQRGLFPRARRAMQPAPGRRPLPDRPGLVSSSRACLLPTGHSCATSLMPSRRARGAIAGASRFSSAMPRWSGFGAFCQITEANGAAPYDRHTADAIRTWPFAWPSRPRCVDAHHARRRERFGGCPAAVEAIPAAHDDVLVETMGLLRDPKRTLVDAVGPCPECSGPPCRWTRRAETALWRLAWEQNAVVSGCRTSRSCERSLSGSHVSTSSTTCF